jgi:hypothetical protein
MTPEPVKCLGTEALKQCVLVTWTVIAFFFPLYFPHPTNKTKVEVKFKSVEVAIDTAI